MRYDLRANKYLHGRQDLPFDSNAKLAAATVEPKALTGTDTPVRLPARSQNLAKIMIHRKLGRCEIYFLPLLNCLSLRVSGSVVACGVACLALADGAFDGAIHKLRELSFLF